MARPSWHLKRRTFLKGAGIALALPFLDAMHVGNVAGAESELPRRMCGVYFPFGVSLPPADHEHAEWNWFPQGEGREFSFTRTLSSLENLKQDVTVLAGLFASAWPQDRRSRYGRYFSHRRTAQRKPVCKLHLARSAHCSACRRTKHVFASLTLSSDGGVGEPTRSTTLSFFPSGSPHSGAGQAAPDFRAVVR